MIKPFEHFEKEKLVKKSTPNISMAKSLIIKSEIRFLRIINDEINEKNSSVIFEDIYEAIREATQALMEIKGYKPYSHEALISFINKNKLLPSYDINVIDNYRILRNKSVYSAENISVNKCEEALEFAKQVLPRIKDKFENS